MDYFQREIVGWLCILVGNFFLAKSVISRRDRGQMRELLGLPTDKVKRFRNFFRQRLERIVGFLFLLVGVGLQLYVVVRRAQKAEGFNDPREALGEISTYLAVAIVALLLFVALLHLITDYFSKRIFMDNLGYLMVRQRYRLADDPALMKQIGELLGADREDDDTVESYTLRLQEALKLDEIRAKLLARGKLPDLGPSTYERRATETGEMEAAPRPE